MLREALDCSGRTYCALYETSRSTSHRRNGNITLAASRELLAAFFIERGHDIRKALHAI